MNTRLKFALLARSDRGFALPLALLIGVILIGTGITIMTRSQGDQSKVVAQKARADGLTGTEAGLARVQEYLNTVRIMATRDSTCAASDDNCWANARIPADGGTLTPLQKELVALQTSTTCNNRNDPSAATRISSKVDDMRAILGNGGRDTIVANAAENRFLDYQVVNYDFVPAPSSNNQLLGQGVLTLEGRSRKTVFTNTATDHSESSNQLVVGVPVLPSYPVAFSRTTVPAVWISQGGVEDSNQTSQITAGNPRYSSGSNFQGDVVMSDATAFADSSATLRPNLECFISSSKLSQPSPAVSPTYQARFFTSLSMPSLPEMPTYLPDGQQDLEINSTMSFPRTGDLSTTRSINGQPVQMYEYTVTNINLDGRTVTIPAGTRVVFYVKGNINTSGNGGIKHDCSSSSTCKPTDVQIFAYNTENATNPQVCLKGRENLEAFIFAPGYALGIQNNNSRFVGAMWGKSWGKIPGCSENNRTAIIQGARWDDLIVNLKPAPLRELPRIGQVTTWCEESTDTTSANTQCVPGLPGSGSSGTP